MLGPGGTSFLVKVIYARGPSAVEAVEGWFGPGSESVPSA